MDSAVSPSVNVFYERRRLLEQHCLFNKEVIQITRHFVVWEKGSSNNTVLVHSLLLHAHHGMDSAVRPSVNVIYKRRSLLKLYWLFEKEAIRITRHLVVQERGKSHNKKCVLFDKEACQTKSSSS